ncbi:TPA: VENN motif pre-toxin domain-containing protein [Proteus mirabilis]|nr:VENN motif pre-toxin domain-containing protein [Proteus mirabilis]HEK2724056.1 VENN motif pre-toxin domain-containing protein [Proteus mirabilis]
MRFGVGFTSIGDVTYCIFSGFSSAFSSFSIQAGNKLTLNSGQDTTLKGAHVILNTLFPGKEIWELSENEKQQVSALSQLASGLAGELTTGDVACQRSTKTDPLLTQIRSIKSDPPFHLGMAPERRLSFNR